MPDPSLDGDLRALRESHSAAAGRVRSLRRISRLMSVAFITVVIGFIGALYNKATTQYAAQNFREPLAREAEALIPLIESEARTLWEDTAPTYGDLAVRKFEEALPALQEASVRELDALLGNISTSAERQVDAALRRIAQRQQDVVAAHFPEVTTQEGTIDLAERWMTTLAEDVDAIVRHSHELYSEDLGVLQATLDQFLPNEYEALGQEELMQEFVHLWLMKVDRWVLLGEEGTSLAKMEDVEDGY